MIAPLFYLKETAVGKVVLTTFVALYEAASSSTMINKEIKMSHLMAGVTSIVWGTTLVSSKVLLHYGLTPAQIMLYRFIIAYLFLWILYPRTHRIKSVKDEFSFLSIGFFGGTFYFLLENTALEYTQATNVGLICATVPLLTAMLAHLFMKGVRLSRYILAGSILSLAGVALVVFNGNFILKLNPLGDLLTFGAAFSWAVYSILIRHISGRYNVLFITRKLFLYGLLTLSPYFLFQPFGAPLKTLLIPEVAANLLFLGVIASSLCYVMWSVAIKNLGPITTNNYIYLLPFITMLTAAVVLDEKITMFVIIGALLIIGGVWYAENGHKVVLRSKRVLNS